MPTLKELTEQTHRATVCVVFQIYHEGNSLVIQFCSPRIPPQAEEREVKKMSRAFRHTRIEEGETRDNELSHVGPVTCFQVYQTCFSDLVQIT